jgi:translation initiation factor eIF-2B subunit epsilon
MKPSPPKKNCALPVTLTLHFMSSKNKKSTPGPEFKQEEVLQAILLADSFAVKFRPITKEKPKVLLPLVNIPMLEYTLESLAGAGVREIFVVCCSHAAQIDSYLKSSSWTQRSSVRVSTIVVEDAFSAGDALRRIHQLQVIRSDPFVLISGDVVSNIELHPIIKEHKAARAINKSVIMTVLFKRAQPGNYCSDIIVVVFTLTRYFLLLLMMGTGHRTRSVDDDTMIAVSPISNELLLYESNPDEAVFDVPASLLRKNADVMFHFDLMDCQIDICSPEVCVLSAVLIGS